MPVYNQDAKDVLSVFEFFEMLPDEQSAIEFIESVRWSDGAICPRCKSARTKKIANQKRYNCNDCRRQFSVRTGTVFENSRIPSVLFSDSSVWCYNCACLPVDRVLCALVRPVFCHDNPLILF